MKLKAVVGTEVPDEFVEVINNLRAVVVGRVLARHLSVDPAKWGPADFYVQKTDYAVSPTGHFCVVGLSGVSVTDDRAPNDFRKANDELESIYIKLIEEYFFEDERVHLFVVIALDAAVKGSSLVEGTAKWVQGKKKRPLM